MALAESNRRNEDSHTGATIDLRAARIAALAERYPRLAAGVSLTLAVTGAIATDVQPAPHAAALTLAAGGVVQLHQWRHRPTVEEPWQPTPTDWWNTLCWRARLTPPEVLGEWCGESGHVFYVRVTNVYLDGRPMSVATFKGFASLLRDCAGEGCTHVAIDDDPANGGVAFVYVNGFHLSDPPPRTDDPTTVIDMPTCCQRGCEVRPIVHLLTQLEPVQHGWFCATHADLHSGYAHDAHDYTPGCASGEWCFDHDGDTADRKWIDDPEPLLPLHIRAGGAREGSGVGLELPPPDPATKRPAGADPGTLGGRVFDTLAAAPGPLRRGQIAEGANASPGTVSNLLDAWADLGAVESIAGTWLIAPRYRLSANISSDGDETTDRG